MALGWPSVEMMLEEMSGDEYVHWQAFFSTEPFPEVRADLRLAEQLRLAIMTASGGKQNPKVAELMADWWGDIHPKQTPEQMQMNLRLVEAAVKAGRKK